VKRIKVSSHVIAENAKFKDLNDKLQTLTQNALQALMAARELLSKPVSKGVTETKTLYQNALVRARTIPEDINWKGLPTFVGNLPLLCSRITGS
jgi:TRAP-type mannitol/chloroaromatic compound transport system substrate-binding protein